MFPFQELQLYLLQLVQALKYENSEDILAAYEQEREQASLMPQTPATPAITARRGSNSSLPGSISDSSTISSVMTDSRER